MVPTEQVTDAEVVEPSVDISMEPFTGVVKESHMTAIPQKKWLLN